MTDPLPEPLRTLQARYDDACEGRRVRWHDANAPDAELCRRLEAAWTHYAESIGMTPNAARRAYQESRRTGLTTVA